MQVLMQQGKARNAQILRYTRIGMSDDIAVSCCRAVVAAIITLALHHNKASPFTVSQRIGARIKKT